MTMDQIERLTRDYAAMREQLAERVQALQDDIEIAKRRRLRGIKTAVGSCAAAHDRLKSALEAAPELFQRPRTVVISGVRVGWAKGKGKIVVENPGKVCDLIRKHYPEAADTLIATTEAPSKTGLALLTVAELKRLGVTVTNTDDQVVIKPTDSEVDKLVNALMADAQRIEEAA